MEKSWKKKENVSWKMSWKNRGSFQIYMQNYDKVFFLKRSIIIKAFLPQITVLKNLNFDLERSWKSPGKMDMKKCGNPVLLTSGPNSINFCCNHPPPTSPGICTEDLPLLWGLCILIFALERGFVGGGSERRAIVYRRFFPFWNFQACDITSGCKSCLYK